MTRQLVEQRALRTGDMAIRTKLNGMLLAWVAGILFLSWLPKFPKLPLVPPDAVGLVGHIMLYGALTGLVFVIATMSMGDRRGTPHRAMIAFSVSMAVGISIELLQTQFATRTSSLADVAMNLIGGAGAVVLIALWSRRGRWI